MSTSSTLPSRGRRIALLVLLGVLTALFLLVSVTKIYPAEFMATNMGELHYTRPSVLIIGLLELAAAIALWLPRYRTLALSVLLLIMAGSAGSHWGYGHPAGEVIPSFVIAALLFTALWLDRGRGLWDFVFRRGGGRSEQTLELALPISLFVLSRLAYRNDMDEIKNLQRLLTAFRDERDWAQFHNPKDLALGLSIEAAELLELYLWKSPEEADLEKVKEELADVFSFALLLAEKYDLDVTEIVTRKIEVNRSKYPIVKARGSAKKYDEL